jgi:uncharacterized protein
VTPANLIHGIVFAAYLVKGLTGFGPAILFISLGSLVMAPTRVVTISPLLDILAGLLLFWKDRSLSASRYWQWLSLPLLAGVAVGAWGLRFVPATLYSGLLGIVILILGIRFLLCPDQHRQTPRVTGLPESPETGAIIAAIISGITGGLFGISGPPLIWYFGRRYSKTAFRKIIVPLFLVESCGRAILYIVFGMIQRDEWILTLTLVPALLVGLVAGNYGFKTLRQDTFERIIGVVLIISGLRLVVA